MPLFGSKHQDTVAANPPPPSSSSKESHRRSFFSHSSRSTSTSPSDVSHSRNSLSKRDSVNRGGLFHRNAEDPSIAAARERVLSAERAEKEADRALIQARTSVQQAKDHVRQLELEAKEDARLAKIKQEQAGQIGKRAKPLGRHG